MSADFCIHPDLKIILLVSDGQSDKGYHNYVKIRLNVVLLTLYYFFIFYNLPDVCKRRLKCKIFAIQNWTELDCAEIPMECK